MNWDKVYMMPESYNELRRELHDHWPETWKLCQFAMAFDGPAFVEFLDFTLDTVTQFDTDNVDGMCKKFLDQLRGKRGLSPLHTSDEYKNNNLMEKEVRDARDLANVPPWELPK